MILFASRNTKTLTLDTDTGPVEVQIAALPRRHFERAAKASQLDSVLALREMGGKVFLDEIKSLGGDDAVKAAAKRDPLLSFSVSILLEFGILKLDGHKPTPAELDDLTEEPAELIAREVVRLTKPSLFAEVDVPAETTEEAAAVVVAELQHEAELGNA